jgi:hypothetical protein
MTSNISKTIKELNSDKLNLIIEEILYIESLEAVEKYL